SEEENAELFWGVRGAGANFGVVTSFEFRLHPIGPIVTNGFVVYPAELAHDVAAMFREALATAPDELMLSMGVEMATADGPWPEELVGRPVILVGGTHSGSLDDADRSFALLRG